MPRCKNTAPSYCKHKASGQAVVTLDGQDYYLGKYGSVASRREYERRLGQWYASGRSMPTSLDSVTITEVLVDYVKKAQEYYQKNGRPTSEVATVKIVAKALRGLYGPTPALEFGPLAFKAFRQTWIDKNLARKTVNHYMLHVVLAFRHAVGNEKLPVETYQSLKAVEPLRMGRTNVREGKRIKAVDNEIVEQTLPFLPPIVADMVRLQRLTAMRPSEICNIRPQDIDRSGDIWIYIPASHKTEHHKRPRIIPIGREAQNVLAPYLIRSQEAYCFSPAETTEQLRRKRTLERTTALSCGNRPGTNRKRNPKRTPSNKYNSNAYARRIRECCKAKNIDPWSPNQLRKLAATNIRRVADLEAAQTILGHSRKSVTEAYYADPNIGAAIEAARRIG